LEISQIFEEVPNLMLRDLTEDKVSELLGFVTEVEDPAILADDPDLLFSDVNHQLRSQDRVVARSHNTDLKLFD
jgi:hypothetical protein